MSDVHLGVDLGGSSTKLLLARVGSGTGGAGGAGGRADDAAPEALWQHRLDGALVPGTLDALRATVQEATTRTTTTVQSVGVTVPGIVDERTGVVRRSVNMPWLEGVSVPERFGELLGAPAVVVHDGRAAALAEARLGAGRGSDDVFVLALGTGVAGAHVVGGVVRTGAHDGAGEAGHVSLDPVGPRCGCGQRGCLEAYVGGPYLAAAWQRVSGDPAADAAGLLRAAASGDPRAVEVVDAAGSALARSILTLVAVVDPGRIVVGGGLVVAPSPLLADAERKARAGATFHRVPPVVAASLGPWAGAWGAVLAAAG